MRSSTRSTVLRAVVLALVASGLLVLQRPAIAARPAAQAVARPAPITTAGRWLRDAKGRVVYLHGLQVAHKTAPYHPPAGGLTQDDVRLIKGLGINAIRLAWFWKGLEPVRGRLDAAYLAEIVREVDLLTSHGIWVLLEFHQDDYNEAVHGAGFPDWATFTDGAPNPTDQLPGGAYLTNPALQHAYDNLFANRADVHDDFARAWRAVAGAVVAAGARHRHLLGYDLFNEPWPGSQFPTCTPPLGCPLFDRLMLQPLEDKLARAVRAMDRTTPVFYEPHLLADFGAPSHLGPAPRDVQPVGYSFHDYCFPALATTQPDHESQSPGYPACPAIQDSLYDDAVKTAARLGGAPLQTEFGDTRDLAQLERVMQTADRHLTGWMMWGYKDWVDYPGGLGDGDLFDNADDVGTLRSDMANVVARTYPQRIAGTPDAYSYDPASGRMQLAWHPGGQSFGSKAPTVVFVPVARHYPNCYRVRAIGARVISKPCASRLRLVNTGGPASVTVLRVGG